MSYSLLYKEIKRFKPRHTFELLRFAHLHRKVRNSYSKQAIIHSDKPRIIASLTTIPERIDHLDATINSLLDQSQPVNEIVLSVPEIFNRTQQRYVIPKRFLDHPAITILRPGNDLGPITKLLPILEREWKHKDTLILCIDDDMVYPKNLVKTFISAREMLGDVAITGTGYRIPPSLSNKDRKKFKQRGHRLSQPEAVDIIMGNSGFMVTPAMFDKQIFNTTNIPEEAFYADDLWISLHLATKNTKRYAVPIKGLTFFTINLKNTNLFNLDVLTKSQNSLGSTVNDDGENNEKLMRRFVDSGLTLSCLSNNE
jgi:hypothetical protein